MARWAQPKAHRSRLKLALTEITFRQAKPAGRPIKLANTAGLCLEVKPAGSKLSR